MSTSNIEWTDRVWNPVTGCTRVSPGCANCYALTYAARLKAMGQAKYQRDGGRGSGPGFGVTLHPATLSEPLRWRKPARVFVNSMSDLFHEEVPDEFIASVFAVMNAARRHTFQVLTKRPDRMRSVLAGDAFWDMVDAESSRIDGEARIVGEPLPNVWLGTSIENRRFVHRADQLRATPAAVRFISAEPLLGPLIHDAMSDGPDGPPDMWQDGREAPDLDLDGIHWLIVGGESGPGHRRIDTAWVRDLRDACTANGTAFFLKQWGGARPGGLALLDNHAHHEFPTKVTA